ncbi:MAG: hypothetical protein NTNFB01_09740 [Nitrospira sp.]
MDLQAADRFRLSLNQEYSNKQDETRQQAGDEAFTPNEHSGSSVSLEPARSRAFVFHSVEIGRKLNRRGAFVKPSDACHPLLNVPRMLEEST